MKKYLQIASSKIKRLVSGDNSTCSNDARLNAILNEHCLVQSSDKSPQKLFAKADDDFWFWLNTEGLRMNADLQKILPEMPDEDIQLNFTGNKGDVVLREGFNAYLLFKEIYENKNKELKGCERILDFGCGWGRIIRFFLRDVDPSALWGCDPVQEMIDLCRQQNKWCQFQKIDTKPPTPFDDNTFDMIYGFSIFSHLSEAMHKACLLELNRILKPGGTLIVTTRSREFIKECAQLRQRSDLEKIHKGPRSSAYAFVDTSASLADYDEGRYCFHQLVHEGDWSYWGETAIPKTYILNEWTQYMSFVDFIVEPKRCDQNVIVVQKKDLR